MANILTLEELLAPDSEVQEVELPRWGGAVKIKGLTRGEITDIRSNATVGDKIDDRAFETGLIAAGLVEPKLDQAQANALYNKLSGPVTNLIKAILKVSGMEEGAQTEQEKSFRA